MVTGPLSFVAVFDEESVAYHNLSEYIEMRKRFQKYLLVH
jgi:hypothetical protein